METADRSAVEEIARLQRQLEECRTVRESNRSMAAFGMEEARLWKRRAKFHESQASSLRIGYNQMARYLMEDDSRLYRQILQRIDADFHPGDAPLFNQWDDEFS